MVLLDPKGRAVDLCPPAEALTACELEGNGGELLVDAPEERSLDADVVLLEASQPPVAIGALYEARLGAPGTQRLKFSAATLERELDIEGATRCAVRLDDGLRLFSCAAHLPAGVSGVALVQHGGGPLRATLRSAKTSLVAARFGELPAEPAAAIGPAFAASLSGASVRRAFHLDREAVVRMRADNGVCALVDRGAVIAQAGSGAGCDLYRLLPAGDFQLAVRSFAQDPRLSGTVSWTQEPVEPIAEGVGPERWLLPGEERFFRFTTSAKSQVGLGLIASTDDVDCRLHDESHQELGVGCQQYLTLGQGTFVFAVKVPEGRKPMSFKPVVFGLKGGPVGVPDEYLRDFFSRIGFSR